MSPHKKMKMTIDSDDLVRVHLDHHIGSALLKQKIQSNPFILKSLTRVESFAIDQKAELIGFCDKYGLIFSNQTAIYFVKNGQVTLELKNLCTTGSACVELGIENDYVIFIGDSGELRKVDLDGNWVWLKENDFQFSNVAYDATSNRIIANDIYNLYLIEPKTGEIVHSIDCPSVNNLCVGHDGKLFVLCGNYSKRIIMVLYGENYSQSRILTSINADKMKTCMHIWDGTLVVNNQLNNNVQEIMHVDANTGKIQECVTCRDVITYRPMGKYLVRKGVKEISVFEARVHEEHFDCIWSKEVHSLMKKLNIEIPQKCDSIIYNDVPLPKSIVWFLNMNCGITNCLQYCGDLLEEENEDDKMDSDAMDEFGEIFCFVLDIALDALDIPKFVRKWMENNNDGIILGSYPTESGGRTDCYIATKTSECIGEEFPLYLIKRNHEIETCSLFEFLYESKPVLATFIESYGQYDGVYELGIFEFDYMACIQELKEDNIICDGKIDTKALLSAYQGVDESVLHRLSTVPKEILRSKIEFEGNKYLCRDLLVLAFQCSLFTTPNFHIIHE